MGKDSERQRFEKAFQDRIGRSPAEFIQQKLANGTEPKTIQYQYEMMAAEIARQNSCAAPPFGLYASLKKKAYHKLVRDRIPEIIEASGKTCTWETLSDEEYLQLLDEKLNEELAEYQESKSLEELADLLEVVQAVVRARGWTPEQLEQLRADKAAQRGGFEKRILLTSVRKKEDYRYLLVMRDFLQASGKLYSTTFPQLVRQRQQGKVFSFREHLRGLLYAQLSAHTQWHRVAPKLPQVDDLFFQYDEQAILAREGSYFTEGLKQISCASQCTNRQMKHLGENIEKLRQMASECGSLDAYVTSAPPEAIVRDLAAGPHKLYGIGPALAWEYLRNVGIDGVKPDIHVCRFLGADRMGESEQEQAAPDEAVAIVHKMSKQLHLPMVEIDSILWSYCASHYGEICTATPHCDACVVRGFCTRKEG